jgi:hypothetical protein
VAGDILLVCPGRASSTSTFPSTIVGAGIATFKSLTEVPRLTVTGMAVRLGDVPALICASRAAAISGLVGVP